MKAAYRIYSLKEEREFRVVPKGVPKEFSLEDVKTDLLAQKIPVRAVRRVTNRNCEPLDLVLVSADPSTKGNRKAIFFNIKTVCSLSGIKNPHKKAHQDSVITVKFMVTVLRIVLEKHAALSIWATMDQQRALETKKETACSLVFFVTRLTTRPTTWDVRTLPKNTRFHIRIAKLKITLRTIRPCCKSSARTGSLKKYFIRQCSSGPP
ncbi:hypothetical protein EVAR_89058_1 [Eumeta japonica]|uniref:Pre-C2HC domain-containing protein n=1 Tax=Eumeta variegata TaxID=151549 RepID=A0A4C1XIL9_EUMVA|nr:hypothetical protein EVAR_89058_1 [Eumeta japonica]